MALHSFWTHRGWLTNPFGSTFYTELVVVLSSEIFLSNIKINQVSLALNVLRVGLQCTFLDGDYVY